MENVICISSHNKYFIRDLSIDEVRLLAKNPKNEVESYIEDYDKRYKRLD